MSSRTATCCLAVAASLLVHPRLASAQGAPTWNRKVEALSVLPSSSSSARDVHAALSFEAHDLTSNTDLSVLADLLVNGVPHSSQTIIVSAGPNGACSSCCAAAGCPDGDCVVLSSSPCICNCGFASTLATYPGVPLQPGDEIMVLLRPAPGAIPDTDQSDDSLMQPYGGGAKYWNRRVRSMTVTPSPGAPLGDQFFDVFVELSIETGGGGGIMDLTTEVDLLINGAPAGQSGPSGGLMSFVDCSGNCGSDCAFDLSGTPRGTCQLTPVAPIDCDCQVDTFATVIFNAIPAEPGDVIEVILRPVPGALPELPGFGEDDEEGEELPCPLCEGDTDGDGIIGITDLLKVLEQWGVCLPV